ncbi:MAG: hypothetical protein OCC49_05770 [Fibrobacterales bacterium]
MKNILTLVISVILISHSISFGNIFKRLSNEFSKEKVVEHDVSTVRIYLHPISYFLYYSPTTLYGTFELAILSKLSFVFQPGIESGAYVRPNGFTNGPDNIVTKNEMVEIKVGFRRYFFFNKPVGPYIQGQFGYTKKELSFHSDGQNNVYQFKYDDWIIHLAGGFAYSYSFINAYADFGVLYYFGDTGFDSKPVWVGLPDYDINIGIGFGF